MERNVWVAGATIILKGVTIGENSVVGAGSVVIGDIPKNRLALGNPAQVIRNL
jgi:acetyltransferase-like isoleucine patch superfamily enzyme